MSELQEKILGIVDANNGSLEWSVLVDGLEYQERQRALSEVRALEQTGVLKRTVTIDKVAGKGVLTISKGSA